MSTCSEKSVEELWYDFTSTLNQLCKESIPSKLIRGKPSLPWITQEIKRLIRKRDSLYSQSKKSDEEDIKHQFKVLRQKIKKKIKISYERYPFPDLCLLVLFQMISWAYLKATRPVIKRSFSLSLKAQGKTRKAYHL